jgi:Leucine-rich repeat (LRR) protein
MSLSIATRKRLRDSRRSGNLALSNAELLELPAAVCNPRDHLDPDEHLYECIDLVKLDVNYNRIEALPEEVESLAGSLVVLQASHNPLQWLPSALAAFSQLKLLNLSHCQFSQFPAVVCALASLVELRLDHNAIEELPADGLGGLVELQVLQLEANRLRALPHSVGRLGKMLRLHLSQNQLSSLPESLGALSRLEVLEVRENALESLSARITTGLQRLRTLDARRNRLRELPLLAEASATTELLLSFNGIAQLDASRLAGARGLVTLDLADNKVEAVDGPAAAAHLQALAFLNVSNNNLRALPHELGYLPKLTRLLAEQNPIRTISQAVLTGSCEALKKYLRSRGPAPDIGGGSDGGSGGGGAASGGGGGGGGGGRSAWSIVEDGQLLLDKLPDASAEATLRDVLQRGQEYATCKTLAAGGAGGGAGRFLPLVVHMLEAKQFDAVQTLRLEKVGRPVASGPSVSSFLFSFFQPVVFLSVVPLSYCFPNPQPLDSFIDLFIDLLIHWFIIDFFIDLLIN